MLENRVPEVMSTADVAAMFGVKPVTIEHNRWSGSALNPPYRKVGRRIYYVREEVLAWLKTRPGVEANVAEEAGADAR